MGGDFYTCTFLKNANYNASFHVPEYSLPDPFFTES